MWWDDPPMLPSLEVDDSKVTFTGLYDLKGNPICRTQPPIGFGRDEEWNG